MPTDNTNWSVAGILSSPLLALFIVLVLSAIALSGRLDVSAAKILLILAWLMAGFAIYRFPPILGLPLVLRVLTSGATLCACGIGLYLLAVWMAAIPPAPAAVAAGAPSTRETASLSSEKVEAIVTGFLHSLPGKVELVKEPTRFFVYRYTADKSDTVFSFYRVKEKRFSHLVLIETGLELTGGLLADFRSLSQDKQSEIVALLASKAAEMKMIYIPSSPLKIIHIQEAVKIDDLALPHPDDTLGGALNSISANVQVIRTTLTRLVRDAIRESQSTQPSSTPNTGASPQ